MHYRMERRSSESDDVLASEVAAYVFCAKAWHLEYVLESTASAGALEKRAAGAMAHAAHGAQLRRRHWTARWLLWGAALLFAIALILLIFGILLNRS